ncbi:uncharacterized protein DFL_001787 [Arthrobotrys flagrans]|uniref:Uncharacterized protein n=1 Tax=Arthrobotrys flagrans TaxID=97331 RepID=A0A437A9D0_ARTFL|nr:hypothetical protein DFL_001787 [Arthrobotrys flagrans]
MLHCPLPPPPMHSCPCPCPCPAFPVSRRFDFLRFTKPTAAALIPLISSATRKAPRAPDRTIKGHRIDLVL